ncbi:hypothetical protein GGF37_000967, partial [Kickxella alabastrina]
MLCVLQASGVKAAAAKRIVNTPSSTSTASRQLFFTSTISREQDGQKGCSGQLAKKVVRNPLMMSHGYAKSCPKIAG